MKTFKKIDFSFLIVVFPLFIALPAYANTEEVSSFEEFFEKYFWHGVAVIILFFIIRRFYLRKTAKTGLRDYFNKTLQNFEHFQEVYSSNSKTIAFGSDYKVNETIFAEYDHSSSSKIIDHRVTNFAAKNLLDTILPEEFYLVSDKENIRYCVLKNTPQENFAVSNPFKLDGSLFKYFNSWWLFKTGDRHDISVVFPKKKEILVYDVPEFNLAPKTFSNIPSNNDKEFESPNDLVSDCLIWPHLTDNKTIAISKSSVEIIEGLSPRKKIDYGFKNVGILIDEEKDAAIIYNNESYELNYHFNPNEAFYFDPELSDNNTQSAFGVVMDQKNKKIAFLQESIITTLSFKDLVDVNIHKNSDLSFSSTGGKSVTSVGGRAIVGGLIFGPAGAVVGGLTGKEKHETEASEENQYTVFLTVNKTDTPTLIFDFEENYSEAYKLSSIFKICMKQVIENQNIDDSSISGDNEIEILSKNTLSFRQIAYR